jgi:hypothetical protein
MREETLQFETLLGNVTARLDKAGGMPLSDAVIHLHAIKRFLASCSACGVERELLVAMERAGVGDLVEALLPLVR